MSETPEKPDKRDKAHATEVNIDNGALFLRLLALERRVKYLELTLRRVENDGPFRVGDNS